MSTAAAQPRVIIDPLSATALRLLPKFRDGVLSVVELATATGFTVIHESLSYLVTNWHVVTGYDPDTGQCLDKKHAAIPNTLAVRFHAKGQLGAWTIVDLPLFDADGVPLWIEHPLGKAIDVVAIPIGSVPDIDVYPLDLRLADTDMLAEPAMPVSVIGYPLGLSAGGNWPIWKTGHIASDPDLDFEPGRPAFLIDATTRSGMSGSPVVLRSNRFNTRDGNSVMSTGMSTKFMGVYAGRIHDDSEVGRVWRPFVLAELLAGRLLFNEATGRQAPEPDAPCPCAKGKPFQACCGVAPAAPLAESSAFRSPADYPASPEG